MATKKQGYGVTGLLWLLCASTGMWTLPVRAQTSKEIVLHNFGLAKGAYPYAGLIRDAAGNLYGTTTDGGTAGFGAVYKLNSAGRLTVLYSFTGGADGSNPYAGVIGDSAGNLYGTTYQGGTANAGVVYKVDASGHETVLHSFTGFDGAYPYAGVIRDSAGNLYGTTTSGGPNGLLGLGVVYKIDAAGNQTVLYAFNGTDGFLPYAGVIRDPAGNLYGTTFVGGPGGAGTVYKLDTSGNETTLYAFTGGADGGGPYAGVIRDPDGNLYGTTNTGGSGGEWGLGVVYKVDTAGRETVLYTFAGSSDGASPRSGVIRDAAGNLYGTTLEGGTARTGDVYKLDSSGHETVLHTFSSTGDGSLPYAGVILDSAGNLYGTTKFGGAANEGMVYKLDAAGNETALYNFTFQAGIFPNSVPIRDTAGNFYGTTSSGGAANAGLIYKLDPTGHYTVLYTFTGGADGAIPSGLIFGPAGGLYGTANWGVAGSGVVYRLDAAGQQTVLYSFTGGADGGGPGFGVIRDPAGNLYGTTYRGGAAGAGVVYKLDPAGQETVLHNFMGGVVDGSNPEAGVIRDQAGNLYGTTLMGGTGNAGVVYKLDPTGHYAVLYNFTGGFDGADPYGSVIRDSMGNLYGTTEFGGTAGRGVVYKLDTAGHEMVLYSFSGGTDGMNPASSVVRDAAGNLYGTAGMGGAGGGVLFEVDAAGNYSVLYSFTGGVADGCGPWTGVIRDAAGNLFGTTFSCGKYGGGVLYALTGTQ